MGGERETQLDHQVVDVRSVVDKVSDGGHELHVVRRLRSQYAVRQSSATVSS